MSYRDPWKKDVEGHEPLRSLHEQLRAEVRDRWNRSLPFADELFDRWERADFLGFGKESSVYDSSVIIGELSVGAGVWIGPFTVLDGSGGLSIGDHACISAAVHIYSHDTVARTLSGGRAAATRSPVSIGACSYIGPHSVIAAGVSIGKHCVVGARSFVNCDVPDNSIVVGAPARIRGRVRVDGDQVTLDYDESPLGS